MERRGGVASPEGADQVESSAPPPGTKARRPAVVCGRRPREVEEGRSARAMEWPDHGRLWGSGRPTHDGSFQPRYGGARRRTGCRSAMAESPAAAPEQDVVLATKLHLPASRPGLVPRPRLTAHLDEGLARGLVLACAPAGYGKTVLLADWAQSSRHPAAWLSLDAGDNDPARFWRHVVAALDRASPGTGDRLAPLLGPPAPSSFQGLVTALINELASEEAV